MAIAQTRMAVTSTAAAISTAGALPDGKREGYRILIQNTDTVAVYVGNASVTTSTYGYKLDPGDVLDWRITADEVLYLVTASTATVSVLVGLG